MKILLVHNMYRVPGGEDAVVAQERDLLRSRGHEVIEFTKNNNDIAGQSQLQLARSAVWASEAYKQLRQIANSSRPDIVHVHNTLPLVSPAVYYAVDRYDVPVVQTLHNYRMVCPNGLLMRSTGTCEDCVGKAVAWPAVVHKCYRNSHGATLAVVTSMAVHRGMGTYRRKVDRYIALCEFARQKAVLAGLPEDRIVVKPNFATDRYVGLDTSQIRRGALFVGRLSAEKGIHVLLRAWRSLQVDLQVIGPGSYAGLQELAPPRVMFRGAVNERELSQSMRDAQFIVMPSLVYEGFPMVVAEAYAAGLPIVASRLGALAELVIDGLTGLHFNANDPEDLAEKVKWAAAHVGEMKQMGLNARAMYERHYTPQANYERLMQIYGEAAGSKLGNAQSPQVAN